MHKFPQEIRNAKSFESAILLIFRSELERVVGHALEYVEAAAEQNLPTCVCRDRTIMDRPRFRELDVEDDSEHSRALFNLKQVLVLLLQFIPVFLNLDGHELQLYLVGGVLATCDPLDEFHEVPGLVEHAHVGVNDRDLRGTPQVGDE